MKLSIYDILAKIIPGGIVLASVVFLSEELTLELPASAGIIFAFAIGYFIDAISSFSERPVLFRSFGGNASKKLLRGEGFMHIRIQKVSNLAAFLKNKYPQLDEIGCFSVMHREIDKVGNLRISSMQESYIFARNIFFTVPISACIYLYGNFSWQGLVLAVGLLIVAWIRAKQRNYYFVKEIINTYMVKNMEEIALFVANDGVSK